MNLQILSNTVRNDGRTNYTNEFEMKLAEPIDALNHDAFFELTEISYPGTTKNIADDSCWGFFHYDVCNFKYSKEDGRYVNSKLAITSDKFIIPEGSYTLENLLRYSNNALNEYDIAFILTSAGKVKITVNVRCEYWVNQETPTITVNGKSKGYDGEDCDYYHMSTASSVGTDKKFCVVIKLKISKKLAFMLGFVDDEVSFIQTTSGKIYDITQTVVAPHLPDISDGLDKIFIYCNELERSFIGDTSAELIATVPIRWSEQGKGNGELIIYSPPVPVKRKFKKANISSLHIALKDSVGVRVPFDSGTVSIEGVVHYA